MKMKMMFYIFHHCKLYALEVVHSRIVMLLYLKVCDDCSFSFSFSFLILDLPKLHTISFIDGYALAGDNRDNRKAIINGHESFDNTLIMKSKLK